MKSRGKISNFPRLTRILLVSINFGPMVGALINQSVPIGAAQVRVPVVADTAISSYFAEVNFNYGKSAHLRIKGHQGFMLMKFDLSKIKSWTIARGTLYLHVTREDHKLRIVGLSTISSDWVEGEGNGSGPDSLGGGCCFNYARYDKVKWAGWQSDFTDVSFSNGNTLAAYVEVRKRPNNWLEIDIPVFLIQALVCGDSFGLAVSDEKGQTWSNNDVHSREQSQYEPFLIVEGEREDEIPPSKVTSLRAVPFSEGADFWSGAVKLSFKASGDDGYIGQAFRYLIRYKLEDADSPYKELPRYLTPHPKKSGEIEEIVVPGLEPRKRYSFVVTAIDGAGNSSEPVTVIASASDNKVKPPPLPVVELSPWAGREPPVHNGALRVWACSDVQKVHPISGNLLEEVGLENYAGEPKGEYREKNYLWDGATSIVHLEGARNEFVAFQLIIEATKGNLKNIQVSAEDLIGPGGSQIKASENVKLFKVWYVKEGEWFGEVALPLVEPFDIPDRQNRIEGQRNQSVFVDLYIPHEVMPGSYRGYIVISAEGVETFKIHVALTVWNLMLPDKLSFIVDLNCYGPFGSEFGVSADSEPYRDLELRYHQMAHIHRATLNILPYSQSGRLYPNYAPPLEGKGKEIRVKDWSNWDKQFGRYLDGSAFSKMPRKGVPISHMYLPFHENWPSPINEHYQWTPTVKQYPDMIVQHALEAPAIEEAFDQLYKDQFIKICQEYAKHFQEKGWTNTEFQFYLNNKYYYKDPKQGGRGTSWWLLDEPMHRDDWLALAFFGRMFKEGVKGAEKVKFIFREDVSRPQFQRDYLDNLVDLMVTSDTFFSKNRRCLEMQKEWGVKFWNYGTANRIGESNLKGEAWVLKTYLCGGDGIIPWQTIGKDENFDKPEATALLYPGKRFDIFGPLSSLRLKALRRGQQDVEYLVLLAKAKGWDRNQIGWVVVETLDLTVKPQEVFIDEAGNTIFDNLKSEQFVKLRASVAAEIGGKRR